MWSMNMLLVILLVIVPAWSVNVKEGDWEVGHCILASMDLQLVIQFMDTPNNFITLSPAEETVTGTCDSNTTQEMTISWKEKFPSLGNRFLSLGRIVTFKLSRNESVYGINSLIVAYQHEGETWMEFIYEDQGLLFEIPVDRTYSCQDLTRESDSIRLSGQPKSPFANQAWIEMSKYEKDKAQEGEKKTPFLDRWIKSQLKGRDSDGYPVYQENFLRQSIKEFPFPEAQLFKMLVMNFSKNTQYGEDATAVDYINQAFNGNKGFQDHESCRTCATEEAEKKCSTCKSVQYCDQVCQRHHWFVHKKFCPKMKEHFDKMVEENKKKAAQEEKNVDGDKTKTEGL